MFYGSFAYHPATVADWHDVGRVTIDMVPDVALLEIFDFYLTWAREEEEHNLIQTWHTLVHVCQIWRTIVFGSPRRLNLRLFCNGTTPVKESLGVWPPLPIVIGEDLLGLPMENIIAALEHNDRVCDIWLAYTTKSQLEQVLPTMQRPFPELTRLGLGFHPYYRDDFMWELEGGISEKPVVPESFLGGSAPRLQHLELKSVPYPGLPKLLLSATGLVDLLLEDIPHSGYISPQAMVRCLSTLTSLESLVIGFKSPLCRPARETRPPHLHTRSILVALTYFRFKGLSEYLEDLVTRIDAPLLDTLDIRFFHQLIFDTPQLVQFVDRSPNAQPPVEARIVFSSDQVEVTSSRMLPKDFALGVRCGQLDRQLSFLAQVCNSSFPEKFIPKVEHLYICGAHYDFKDQYSEDDIEASEWLEVLHPFTAVKHLYLSRDLTNRMAPVLQELAGEVLPSLEKLLLWDLQVHLSGPVQEAIGKFVAARQLSGHPIDVCQWDRKEDKWSEVDD